MQILQNISILKVEDTALTKRFSPLEQKWHSFFKTTNPLSLVISRVLACAEMAERSSASLEDMVKEIASLETDNVKLVHRIAELKHKIDGLRHEKSIIQREIEENMMRADRRSGKHPVKSNSIYAEAFSEEDTFEQDSEL